MASSSPVFSAPSLLRRAHQPQPPVTTVYVTPAAPAPAPSTMTSLARLYPANDVAAAYGVVNAAVTNDLNGRGVFTTNINGETFNGEATRVGSGSARIGLPMAQVTGAVISTAITR